MQKEFKDSHFLLFSSLLITAVFIVDLFMPLGVAMGICYAPALFIAAKAKNHKIIYTALFISIIFTALGLIMSPPGIEFWKIIANRALSLTLIIAISALIINQKQAEERFKLLIEASPSGMIMINHTGDIVLVNKQVEKMFGYNDQFLLNQKIETLLPIRFRAEHPKSRDSFFAQPEAREMGAG